MGALLFAFRMLMVASVGWAAKDITESIQEMDEQPIQDNLKERAGAYLTVPRWITIGGIGVVLGAAAVFKMTKSQRKKLLK